MVVTWQNPFLQPTRPPGFVAPEEWGQETPTQLPNQGVGGVGAPQPIEQVQSMFTPAEATGNGMFGGDGGGGGAQPNQPEGDFPSASSIERRRKLAEALMGKQMEVNHPMQAVANAVSQIAGAWMNKKADDEQAQLEKRRREVVSGGFEKSGGNFDAMMDEWMKSGDPELVDKALDYKLRKAAAAADGGDAPTTRNFYEGNAVVTKQWNPETKQWETVGSPSPRWKADGSEYEDGGYDPVSPDPTSDPASAPVDGGAPAGPAAYNYPGKRGKWQPKSDGTYILPDGSRADGIYNPNDGRRYYRAKDGFRELPYDSKRVTTSVGGPVTPQGWRTLRKEWQEENNSLKAIRAYFANIKDLPSGYRRWSNDIMGKLRTWMGANGITPDQLKQMIANGQIQGLLGMFRTEVVGPGVMTEFDARRVIDALGGLPSSAFQNPDAMMAMLQELYGRKLENFRRLDEDLGRSAPAYGYDYKPTEYPDKIGDPMPGEGVAPDGKGAPSAPSAPRTPRPSGSKVVLPPKEKRIIGKTEYKAPNGQSFVWGRDASGKVGWIPK